MSNRIFSRLIIKRKRWPKHVLCHETSKMNSPCSRSRSVNKPCRSDTSMLKLNRLCWQQEKARRLSFHSVSSLLVCSLADIHIKGDEYPRKQTTIDALANLKTVFKEGMHLIAQMMSYVSLSSGSSAGTVTAGNASGLVAFSLLSYSIVSFWYCLGLNDGAAAVVLCSNRIAKLKQLAPLAKIVSYGQSGIDPLLMVNASLQSASSDEVCVT